MRQSILFLLAAGACAQASAIEPAKIAGIWKAQKSAMIGHATAYMTFDPQGTCSQITNGVILGVNKWQSLVCKWTLEGDALTITATGPATEKDLVGKTVRYKATLAADGALTLEADGNAQSSTRVD